MIRRVTIILLCIAMVLSAGCLKKKKEEIVTAISVDIIATSNLNPDVNSRPSPVVVRLYQLKTPGKFEAADFNSLYNNDAATLGSDLVKREEYILRPGELQQYKNEPSDEARYLGVVAAFRNIDSAGWKSQIIIPQGQRSEIKVLLESLNVAIIKQ